ncbi:MAG: branched-chain amino acid ABC transporter ATP-binding protein [Dehalococcoidia bacterium SM23_28_2]|nr:MAG: branched-chain amino acid ABC transporter ATP-binding protein [Dehalococcoidia bacterium SM23_28_2]
MTMLEAREVVSGYGEVEILHGVSIKVEEEQIVTIIGPNGAGKSTLLKTVFGLLPCRRGRVLFGGEDVTGQSPQTMVRKGMCYVPQSENVFPTLTVQENLEMGAFIRRDNYRPKMEEVLALFPDVMERRHTRAGKLSGGQRQMLALARALMLEPRVLLLDEPSASLAPNMVELVFAKISDIRRSGVAIVMVEQNARESLKLSNRGYVLAMGENRLEGTGESLLDSEEVGRLYLGG